MDKTLILNSIKSHLNFVKDIDFADYLGIKQNTLSSWKMRNTIDYDLIITKCDFIDANWLLTGKGEMLLNSPVQVFNKIKDGLVDDIQNVPFYDLEAAAGIVSLFNDQHNNAVDHIHVPGIPKCDGAIKVSGDSMYPLLKSGDIVMYKKVQDPVNAIYFYGEMYIVSIDQDGDDFVVVKYIHRSDKGDGWIKLVSQNPNHDAIDVPTSSIRALALVKASIRINSMQ